MGLKARNTLKTQPTRASARAYIDSLPDPQRRSEGHALLKLMDEITGLPPVMWGASIIGYGIYSYRYASGREGDWPRTGFSPRSQATTVYCLSGFDGQQDLLERLGRHRIGRSCLYIPRLYDVDIGILRTLIERSLADMARRYPES